MTDHTYLHVVWRDAHAASDTWTHIDDIDPDDCLVTSVGILLADAKPGYLVLAQSMINGANTVDGVLAIPHGMVISKTVIVA